MGPQHQSGPMRMVPSKPVRPSMSGLDTASGKAANFTRLTLKPLYRRLLAKETAKLIAVAQQDRAIREDETPLTGSHRS